AAEALRLLLHMIQQTAGLRDDLGTLLRGVALPEKPVKNLARIILHRQWLRRCTKCDGACETAAHTGRARQAPFGLDRKLQGRQRRVLADATGGYLVGAHSADSRAVRVARPDARQPGAGDDSMRVRALAALVAQARDDRRV